MNDIKPNQWEKSALVEVMAWCHLATSHYLNQWWPCSIPYYGIIRGLWVNPLRPNNIYINGFVQDCSNSIANAMELMQSCAKPLICFNKHTNAVSDNGLSPVWRQAIIWTNAATLSIRPKNHISVTFYLKFESFHSGKCTSKCCPWNGGHFVLASMC